MPELHTARHVGYYVSADCTNRLQSEYGAHVNGIPINDRNALMTLLGYYIYINSIPMFEGRPLHVCAEGVISEEEDVTSEEMSNILEILAPITVDQARSLLHAISS